MNFTLILTINKYKGLNVTLRTVTKLSQQNVRKIQSLCEQYKNARVLNCKKYDKLTNIMKRLI